MAFGSIDGVKNVLRSAPPAGQPFISIPDHVSEARALELLEVTAEFMVSKIGFEPQSTHLLAEINNKLTAWHIYIEAWSSAGQLEPGIPEQVKAWRDWALSILEDPDFISSLTPATVETAIEAEVICDDIVRIQDEALILQSEHDSFLGHYPVIEYSEEVRDAKRGGGTKFTRNTDYKIWYSTGRIRLISGGGITPGQTLYVTYRAVRRRKFVEAIEDGV